MEAIFWKVLSNSCTADGFHDRQWRKT